MNVVDEMAAAPKTAPTASVRPCDGAASIYSGGSGARIETAPGPFLPNGPPFDPSFLELERNVTDLVSVGDGVCALYWQQPVPKGAEIEGDQEDPQALQCQLDADEVTYQFYGRGVSPEDAVEILADLAG